VVAPSVVVLAGCMCPGLVSVFAVVVLAGCRWAELALALVALALVALADCRSAAVARVPVVVAGCRWAAAVLAFLAQPVHTSRSGRRTGRSWPAARTGRPVWRPSCK